MVSSNKTCAKFKLANQTLTRNRLLQGTIVLDKGLLPTDKSRHYRPANLQNSQQAI